MDPSILQSIDPDRVPRILLANLYPKQVWYFMATFIGLVAACHAASLLYAYLTRRRPPPSNDGPLRHDVSWRRLPLATLNLFRTIIFRWSIVIAGSYTLNVADFLLAAMYLTVLFTWTFINSKNTLGVKYDPKYWANRCAHIAGSQLPLMTAFGMKNNIMSFLTGISFDKMEHLHRVMARVICVMFWVHAFGRVVLVLADDPKTYWFRIGVTGASALTLLCLLSVRPLRARNYELFMYLHLGLGILTLVGAYIHSSEFGYGSYIWPALFLWGLDRFLRFVRISLFNSQLFNAKARGIPSNATVTVLPGAQGHFLRILVDAPPHFVWRAGQSAYLTIFGAYPTSITEAHPFTIANAPHDNNMASPDVEDDKSNDAEEGSNSNEGNKEKDDLGATATAVTNGARRLTFILRVRTGFTKRLLNAVLAHPDSDGVSRSFKAFIDGPYSSPPVLSGFESVVLICGGSGVSFALPLFLDLVQSAKANPRCRRVVLVWAVRDPDQINWIARAVTHVLSVVSSTDEGLAIDVRLHVTTAPEDTQSLDGSVLTDAEACVGADPIPTAEKLKINAATTANERDRMLAIPSVKLVYGRPDVADILGHEIERARGEVGVCVCGTTELAQSVRRALSDGAGRFVDILRGGPSVILHVEGFGNT
ncbi:ferric reductase NAD binding domain-containing protein [Mycena vitilis]|nr:ferric reductase NAD binding domain-containing protein [Mycena vitilis]